jgi:hypothetical protein
LLDRAEPPADIGVEEEAPDRPHQHEDDGREIVLSLAPRPASPSR